MAAHPPGTDLAFHLAHAQRDHHARSCTTATSSSSTRSASTNWLPSSQAATRPNGRRRSPAIPAETIRRIAREFAAAAPHALAHNGWRTSNFVNSFQTERAIAILNALVGNWGVTLHRRRRRGRRRAWARRPSRPIRASPRCAWTACRGSIPFVPLKIGVFQELRDTIAGRRAVSGARLVHLPPESGHVPARPQQDARRPSARWISSSRWTSS